MKTLKIIFSILWVISSGHISGQLDSFSICDRIIMSDSSSYAESKNAWLSIKNHRQKVDPNCTLVLLGESLEHGDTAFFKREMKMLIRNFGYKMNNYTRYEGFYKDISNGRLTEWFAKTQEVEFERWKKNNPKAYLASEKLELLFQYDQSLIETSLAINDYLLTDERNAALQQFTNDEYKKVYDEFISLCVLLNEMPNNFNSGYMGGNIAHLIIDHSISDRILISERWEKIYPYWQTSYMNGHSDDWVLWLYDEASIELFGFQCYNTHKDFPASSGSNCPNFKAPGK